MRSVALAGLMAALPVRVRLAQRWPSPFPSYSYRIHNLVPCECVPVTDARIQPPRSPGTAPSSGSSLSHAAGAALVYGETQRTWGHARGRFHVKHDWTGDGLSQNDEASHLFVGYTLTRTLRAAVGVTPRLTAR